MRWPWIVASLALAPAAGCSCGGGGKPDGDADSDSDADTDADSDSDADSDADVDAGADLDSGVDSGPCTDADGDTYGDGCEAGTDCDDADPERHAGCDVDCQPDPTAEGCPCGNEDPAPSCFGGDPDTQDVGTCHAGSRACDHGEWGPCEGQVLARDEVCDGLDDDCDGTEDDGVLGECGDCNPACRLDDQEHGEFDPEEMDGVVDDEEADGLIITTETREAGYAWIANDPESTVSKLDLDTGEEVGRFYVGLAGVANRPSRTAVDGFGDAYVASRAHDGSNRTSQASVTKIAADERDCIDRDADGLVDTSTDEVPMARAADECVIWTTNIGPVGTWARALAIDAGDVDHPEGYVWVGGFYDAVQPDNNMGRAFRLDPSDGSFVDIDAGDAFVPADGVRLPLNPYGAAADPTRIWFTDITGGNIVAVDVATGIVGAAIDKPEVSGCGGSYGIAVDGDGRVWTAGWTCTTVWGYDPTADQWTWIQLSGRGYTRGIAIDGEGLVWTAHYTDPGKFSSFPADEFVAGGAIADAVSSVYNFPAGNNGPIGAGVDYRGRIWGVDRSSSNATVYDPADGTFVTYPTDSNLVQPYTYSDFTGFQRRNFTAPRGTYAQVYESDCYIGVADWGELTWDVTTPEETSIRFEAQTAATIEDLDGAPVAVLAEVPDDLPPVDVGAALEALGIVADNVLRLSIVLLSLDRETSPVVHEFSLSWECEGD